VKKANLQEHYSSLVPFAILVPLVLLSAYFRLYHITEMGIEGQDTFVYWHIAESWADGDLVLNAGVFDDNAEYYRPMGYFLYSLALKLFDYADYSIKLLNCFLDFFNILLIYLIGLRINRKWVGLFAATSWAFLPIAIGMTRSELLHTSSATFILISVWLFLESLQRNSTKTSFLCLALSGLALSCGAHTHGDIAFLGPGYIFLIFISIIWNKEIRETSRILGALFLRSLVFTSSFFSLYVFGGGYFGFEKVLSIILRVSRVGTGGGVAFRTNLLLDIKGHADRYLTAFFGGIKLFEFIFVVSVLAFVAYFFWIVFRRKSRENAGIEPIVCLILIVSYIVGMVLLTNKRIISRVFVPLIPLVFLHSYTFLCIILEGKGEEGFNSNSHKLGGDSGLGSRLKNMIGVRQSHGVWVIGVITLYVIYTVHSYSLLTSGIVKGVGYDMSMHRELYNVFREKVNSENKFLVAPHMLPDRRGFSTKAYFGDNAIYMNECNELWNSFVKSNNIRYVCISKTGGNSIEGFFSDDIVPCYGIASHRWDPAWEREHLKKEIIKNRGKVLFESDNWMVFELLSR